MKIWSETLGVKEALEKLGRTKNEIPLNGNICALTIYQRRMKMTAVFWIACGKLFADQCTKKTGFSILLKAIAARLR